MRSTELHRATPFVFEGRETTLIQYADIYDRCWLLESNNDEVVVWFTDHSNEPPEGYTLFEHWRRWSFPDTATAMSDISYEVAHIIRGDFLTGCYYEMINEMTELEFYIGVMADEDVPEACDLTQQLHKKVMDAIEEYRAVMDVALDKKQKEES